MAEKTRKATRKTRYRGRIEQVQIVLGKFFRMFVYQSDWKVFPMAALIAGLLAYVIRTDFMKTMEGTLKGSFAIACVGLWNGCFNSIQVICRERDIVKREHRSGLHISSYIIAHMIYQAVLCLGQTVILLYVFRLLEIRFPEEGFLTPWFRLDLGITVFLITYAADMLALLISAVVRTTTGAMTVMPFILIFQLVFSGGIFSLPSWTKPVTKLTLSNYGLRCICAQADYNSLPMASAWSTIRRMKDLPLEGSLTAGEVLDLMGEDTSARSEVIRELREMPLQRKTKTGNELLADRDGKPVTMGDVIDWAATAPELEVSRQKEYHTSVTIGEIIDIFGEDEVKKAVLEKSAKAGQDPRYERDPFLITDCWMVLAGFAMLYALAAMIALEFIDQDKR